MGCEGFKAQWRKIIVNFFFLIFLFLSCDKDTLLDETLVRLLNLLLGPFLDFLIKSSFKKNPTKSI